MALGGYRSKDGTVRLRAIARYGLGVTIILALIACITLVILTTFERRTAERVKRANAALHAVDIVRIDLTSYARESTLAYLTRDRKYEVDRTNVEGDLLAHIEEARAWLNGDGPQALLEQAHRQVREYMVARRHAETRRDSIQAIMLSSIPALNTAAETLNRLSQITFDTVVAAERDAARWNLVGNILGIAIGLLVLVTSIFAALGIQQWIISPLLALSDGINRFERDPDARVDPVGPLEVRQTAERFNDMAEWLARRREGMLTFLAGVAHDLRNPLSAMRMSVYILQSEKPRPSEQRLRQTLDLLARQVTRLERMVGDFLDASRIEGGHLELRLEREDIRALAREVVDLYQSSSNKHRLVLSLQDEPVSVLCDGERIVQVVSNLVSNAIKYSPSGGDIRVDVSVVGEHGVIAVSDQGIGIGPSDTERIFEPFRRTGPSRETAPGVGLGLSVARHIVEAHGGQIEVESTTGAGSTFRVKLPLAEPMLMPQEESPGPALH